MTDDAVNQLAQFVVGDSAIRSGAVSIQVLGSCDQGMEMLILLDQPAFEEFVEGFMPGGAAADCRGHVEVAAWRDINVFTRSSVAAMCIFIIYDKITDKKACREYSILIPIQMYHETYGLLLRHWGPLGWQKAFVAAETET